MSETAGEPLELIADPLEQAVHDDAEAIDAAIMALDEALVQEEEADAAALMAARTFFNSYRYSTPFRYLIGLASK